MIWAQAARADAHRLRAESVVTYPCDGPDVPGNDIVFGEGFPTATGRARLVPAVILPPDEQPERGALLPLRKIFGLFCNLRPAIIFPALTGASSLKEEVIEGGFDLLVVRELTGGIYFGEPRGIREKDNGEREGFNTLVYSESEVDRIARVAFDIAMKRGKRLCSVDKANVLEVSELWREVVTKNASEYPEVELSHMYVDNAAMQIIQWPTKFDVLITENMFGDIITDLGAITQGGMGIAAGGNINPEGVSTMVEAWQLGKETSPSS